MTFVTIVPCAHVIGGLKTFSFYCDRLLSHVRKGHWRHIPLLARPRQHLHISRPSNNKRREALAGTARTPAGFVGFVQRGNPQPQPKKAQAQKAFPYGTACGLGDMPRTWTGRIVSLEAWPIVRPL